MPDLLLTAKLLSPRGLKGEIAAQPFVKDLQRYNTLKHCFLENSEAELLEELEVAEVKTENNKLYFRFLGYDDRDKAARLTNHYLAVPREEAASLQAGEWHVADLIGLEVHDQKHGYLGQVSAISDRKPQDLMQVSLQQAADLYIPLVAPLLKQVDLVAGRLDVELPEGLYELYRC